jgi:cell wall-associated NlpC family hydrolase
MEKRVLLACISILCASGKAQFASAAERRHHPWFSAKQTPVIESPLLPSREKAGMRDSSVVPLPKSHPSPLSSPFKGEEIASQALTYKGTRYKYGGTTKKGMDCSGLVARVWEDLKMKRVPRMSSDLYTSGQTVHLAELKPGDLVFFKNTSKSGISHVGVYAGNNKFIHAAGRHKGVTIAKLSDPYYQLHYAGARRLY